MKKFILAVFMAGTVSLSCANQVYKGSTLAEFEKNDIQLKRVLHQVKQDLCIVKIFSWTRMVSPNRFKRLKASKAVLQKKLQVIKNTLEKANNDLACLCNDNTRFDANNNPAAAVAMFVALLPWILLGEIVTSSKITAKKKQVDNIKKAQAYLEKIVSTIEKM